MGEVLGKVDPTVALFEQAVANHSRRLLAVARGILGSMASAEDVVQQALLNLYTHRHRYDWRDPGALMRRTVVNEALRLLRRPRMGMVADDHVGSSPTPVGELVGDETIDQVRAAIEQLPEHFRAALVLCEYENLSYVEIAQTLDATIPQVKTWLHRGRRKLAQILTPYMQEHPHSAVGSVKTSDKR